MKFVLISATLGIAFILSLALEPRPAYAQDAPPDLEIFIVSDKSVANEGEILTVYISAVNNTEIDIELLDVSRVDGESLMQNKIALGPGELTYIMDYIELAGTGTKTFAYFVDFRMLDSINEYTKLESTSVEVSSNAWVEIARSIIPIVAGILIGELVRFLSDYRGKVGSKKEEFRIALQNSRLVCILVQQAMDSQVKVPVEFFEKTIVEDDAIQLLDEEANKRGATNYVSDFAELILFVHQYNSFFEKDLERSANFQNAVERCESVIRRIEAVNNTLR